MMDRIPRIFKNFYFLFAFCFLVWMLFFDANDIISQIRMTYKVNKLEDEKAYYKQKIEEVKKDREALLNNKDLLERFAREKYLMKKQEEDLFVVVEDEEFSGKSDDE